MEPGGFTRGVNALTAFDNAEFLPHLWEEVLVYRTLKTVSMALAVSALLVACARNEAAETPPPPPAVAAAKVVSKPVTEFDEFTGRFEAVERVEIRPRVSGYITAVQFQQGHEVRKGDILYVIDPRPYQATLKRAQAELARARTQLTLAQSERERATRLIEKHAISQEEFDVRTSGREQASANLAAAQAAVEAAQLDLSFTQVRAPISGLVGRAEVTPGNLVAAGQSMLTTVVSIDPIYVSFDSGEQTFLKSVGRELRGELQSQRNGQNPIWVGLADETGHPHEGKLVFLDNELDPATGTIHARGLLANADRHFTPGMFARVKLIGSSEYDALLINDSAIGTDQSVKYVLKVGAGNTVEYTPVKLGPLIDGLRVVREGLNADDVIIVKGLQQVRPGMPVTPQIVAMGERPKGASLVAQN